MHIYILYTKFQPNPSTCLGGVVLKRSTLYISLVKILSGIIFPYSCLLVIILLQVHLHMVPILYTKFQQNPSSRLGRVALTE
jgi:hypothetical protein